MNELEKKLFSFEIELRYFLNSLDSVNQSKIDRQLLLEDFKKLKKEIEEVKKWRKK